MDPTSIPPPATNTAPFPLFPAVVPPSTAVPFPPVSVPVPPPFPASASALVSAPAPAEANNHVTPAANANPSAASAPAPRHPAYADMIFSAIGALKEKNGSSKRAIGKYIEQVYRDLPPAHSSLLTHNLKRLKDSGQLVMVKKSYMLPRSDGSAPTPPRGRGRPPKLKLQPQSQQQLQSQPQVQAEPQLGTQQFPQLVPPTLPVPNSQQNAEPVWVALGLGDEPVEVKKRGPGRPRKSGVGVEGTMGQTVPAGRRGRPPGSKNRPRLSKRPGRPPKPKSLSTISNGLKRRPGRPPKIQSKPTVIPFAPPVPTPGEAVSDVQPTIPTATAPTATIPVVSPRPRGRPRKNAAAVSAYGTAPHAVAGVGRVRGRGRGRGRGVGRPPKSAAAGKPKIPGARPVGRPKKGTTVVATSGYAVNDELRGKLEYFQSKVTESLDVLKRHFNHESPVTAIAAIQDLEILSTMDLNAPLRDETQQEQEQQQLPQHQLPSQQHLFAQPQQVLQHQPFVQPQHVPQQPQFYLQEMPQVQLQPQPQQLFQPQGSAPS